MRVKTITSIIICIIVAFVFCTSLVSCNNAPGENDIWENATYTEDTELGSGKTTFFLEVKAEDKSVTFKINTDKNIIGDALKEHKLVSGEQGQYGLYIKVVNGITADYEVNSAYWSFNKNGEYMMTGVDSTEIADGEHYELVYTK